MCEKKRKWDTTVYRILALNFPVFPIFYDEHILYLQSGNIFI